MMRVGVSDVIRHAGFPILFLTTSPSAIVRRFFEKFERGYR